jgi:hypothetical protein
MWHKSLVKNDGNLVLCTLVPEANPSKVVCGTADNGKTATVTCPAEMVITDVTFASYGTPLSSNDKCGAFKADLKKHAKKSRQKAISECVGKGSCSLTASSDIGDDVDETDSTLQLQVLCSRLPYKDDRGLCSNILAGVAGHWPLDPSIGCTKDISGVSRAATGDCTADDHGDQTVRMHMHTAMKLSTSKYVSIIDPLALQGNQFTIATWINVDGTPSGSKFIEKEDSYHFTVDTGRNIQFCIKHTNSNGNAETVCTKKVELTKQRWEFLAVSCDGSAETCILYMNGKQRETVSFLNGVRKNTNAIVVGKGDKGRMEEVYFFNRVLEVREIRMLLQQYVACYHGSDPVIEIKGYAGDGQGDILNLEENINTIFPGDASISFWVKPRRRDTSGTIDTIYWGGNAGKIHIAHDDKAAELIYWYKTTDGHEQTFKSGPNTVFYNRYSHVTIVRKFSLGTVEWFVNGISIAQGLTVSDAASDVVLFDADVGSATLRLGSGEQQAYFKGRLKDFKLFGVGLNSGEVNALAVSFPDPEDCFDVRMQDGSLADGTYSVSDLNGGTVHVMCDMSTDGGGWTLVHHGYSWQDAEPSEWFTAITDITAPRDRYSAPECVREDACKAKYPGDGCGGDIDKEYAACEYVATEFADDFVNIIPMHDYMYLRAADEVMFEYRDLCDSSGNEASCQKYFDVTKPLPSEESHQKIKAYATSGDRFEGLDKDTTDECISVEIEELYGTVREKSSDGKPRLCFGKCNNKKVVFDVALRLETYRIADANYYTDVNGNVVKCFGNNLGTDGDEPAAMDFGFLNYGEDKSKTIKGLGTIAKYGWTAGQKARRHAYNIFVRPSLQDVSPYTCEPECQNSGRCLNTGICRCRPGTGGSQCEQIFRGVREEENFAFEKPASQSSTSGSADAERSVDGDLSLSKCTMTAKEESPWLRIDLLEENMVDFVEIKNSDGDSGKETDFFEVWVGNHPNWAFNKRCETSSVFLHRVTAGRSSDVKCALSGRFVFIVLPPLFSGHKRALSLCEALVRVSNGASSMAIVSDNPEAYWTFRADWHAVGLFEEMSSGQESNLNFMNGASVAEGLVGRTSLNLDGKDDHAIISMTKLFSAGNSLTVEAWVMPAEVSGRTNPIVSRDPWSFIIEDGGSLCGQIKLTSNPGLHCSGLGMITANKWTHVAMVFNGRSIVLYVNGQQVAMASSSGTLSNMPTNLYIGSSSAGAYFIGKIDEVAIYSKPLSKSRLRHHAIVVATAGLQDADRAAQNSMDYIWESGSPTTPDTGSSWYSLDVFRRDWFWRGRSRIGQWVSFDLAETKMLSQIRLYTARYMCADSNFYPDGTECTTRTGSINNVRLESAIAAEGPWNTRSAFAVPESAVSYTHSFQEYASRYWRVVVVDAHNGAPGIAHVEFYGSPSGLHSSTGTSLMQFSKKPGTTESQGGNNNGAQQEGSQSKDRVSLQWEAETGRLQFQVVNEISSSSVEKGSIFGPTQFPYNRWVHVAVVHEGSNKNARMYIDGQLVAAGGGVPVVPAEVWSKAFVGRGSFDEGTGDKYIPPGSMLDEVRIWNVARSQEEIRRDMMGDLGDNATNLLAYFCFDFQGCSRNKDQDGTLIGGARLSPSDRTIGGVSQTLIARTTRKSIPGVVSFSITTVENDDGIILGDSAELSWDVPLDDGASTITGYAIYCDCWEAGGDLEKLDLSDARLDYRSNDTLRIGGLIAETAYVFTITAENEIGEGIRPNAPVPFTAPSANRPSAPRNISLRPITCNDARISLPPCHNGATTAAGRIYLQWIPPSSTGGGVITSYRVVCANLTIDEEVGASSGGGSFTLIDSSIIGDTEFNFKISAKNSKGLGPAAEFKILTNTVSKPAQISTLAYYSGSRVIGETECSGCSVTGGAVRLQWSETPSNGGAEIIGYKVYSTTTGPLPINCGSHSDSSCTLLFDSSIDKELQTSSTSRDAWVGGLEASTQYNLRVLAVNSHCVEKKCDDDMYTGKCTNTSHQSEGRCTSNGETWLPLWCCTARDGQISNPISIETDDARKPGKLSWLPSMQIIEARAVELGWQLNLDSGGGVAVRTELQIRNTTVFQKWNTIYEGQNTDYRIENLLSASNYEIRARYVTITGQDFEGNTKYGHGDWITKNVTTATSLRGEIRFEQSKYYVTEGTPSIKVTVTRIGGDSGIASIKYRTYSQMCKLATVPACEENKHPNDETSLHCFGKEVFNAQEIGGKDPREFCSYKCAEEPECKAFWVYTSGANMGRCCMKSDTGSNCANDAANGRFYKWASNDEKDRWCNRVAAKTLDYEEKDDQVTFDNFEHKKVLEIDIVDDSICESDYEEFQLELEALEFCDYMADSNCRYIPIASSLLNETSIRILENGDAGRLSFKTSFASDLRVGQKSFFSFDGTSKAAGGKHIADVSSNGAKFANTGPLQDKQSLCLNNNPGETNSLANEALWNGQSGSISMTVKPSHTNHKMTLFSTGTDGSSIVMEKDGAVSFQVDSEIVASQAGMDSYLPGSASKTALPYQSCSDLASAGYISSGVYNLFVDGLKAPPTKIYCDQESQGGGWTLVYSNSNNWPGVTSSPDIKLLTYASMGTAGGGTTYSSANVRNIEECQALCNEDLKCMAISYDNAKNGLQEVGCELRNKAFTSSCNLGSACLNYNKEQEIVYGPVSIHDPVSSRVWIDEASADFSSSIRFQFSEKLSDIMKNANYYIRTRKNSAVRLLIKNDEVLAMIGCRVLASAGECRPGSSEEQWDSSGEQYFLTNGDDKIIFFKKILKKGEHEIQCSGHSECFGSGVFISSASSSDSSFRERIGAGGSATTDYVHVAVTYDTDSATGKRVVQMYRDGKEAGPPLVSKRNSTTFRDQTAKVMLGLREIPGIAGDDWREKVFGNGADGNIEVDRGLTLGNYVSNEWISIAHGCPAGTKPYAVTSEKAKNRLDTFVKSLDETASKSHVVFANAFAKGSQPIYMVGDEDSEWTLGFQQTLIPPSTARGDYYSGNTDYTNTEGEGYTRFSIAGDGKVRVDRKGAVPPLRWIRDQFPAYLSPPHSRESQNAQFMIKTFQHIIGERSIQSIQCSAVYGTFFVSFSGFSVGIPYDATPKTVETLLNSMGSISDVGTVVVENEDKSDSSICQPLGTSNKALVKFVGPPANVPLITTVLGRTCVINGTHEQQSFELFEAKTGDVKKDNGEKNW